MALGCGLLWKIHTHVQDLAGAHCCQTVSVLQRLHWVGLMVVMVGPKPAARFP